MSQAVLFGLAGFALGCVIAWAALRPRWLGRVQTACVCPPVPAGSTPLIYRMCPVHGEHSQRHGGLCSAVLIRDDRAFAMCTLQRGHPGPHIAEGTTAPNGQPWSWA